MSDPEVREALAKVNDRLSSMETEVRVVKHDVANMQMNSQGLLTRLDKVEERVGAKIDALVAGVAAITVKQERGAGFFAGMAAVVTFSGGALLALADYFFGKG